MGTEEIAMMLIVHSGDARSLAFNALAAAKEGNFEEADELLKQSSDKALEAHHVQMDLLTKEAEGEKLEIGVLLVHAQDHLMTSMLAQELIKEIVQVYKKLAE
jgi:PTS system cellobiose-specific IIA component